MTFWSRRPARPRARVGEGLCPAETCTLPARGRSEMIRVPLEKAFYVRKPLCGRCSAPCSSRPHRCSRHALRTEPSSGSDVNDADIELQKQLQVRATPHTSTTLPAPPLQLPLEAARITCASVIRTTRAHLGCLQVSWRCQRHRFSILPELLHHLPGAASPPSAQSPASRTA